MHPTINYTAVFTKLFPKQIPQHFFCVHWACAGPDLAVFQLIICLLALRLFLLSALADRDVGCFSHFIGADFWYQFCVSLLLQQCYDSASLPSLSGHSHDNYFKTYTQILKYYSLRTSFCSFLALLQFCSHICFFSKWLRNRRKQMQPLDYHLRFKPLSIAFR